MIIIYWVYRNHKKHHRTYRFAAAAIGFGISQGVLMALLDHEFEVAEWGSGMVCTKMVQDSEGFRMTCGRRSEEHPKNCCFLCRGEAIGELVVDPYDVISGSPITRPVKYCLNCYNLRVMACFEWLINTIAGA